MSDLKYRPLDDDVTEFIEAIEHERKKADAYEIVELFQELTGEEAQMWYSGIIGFGKYHYKYDTGTEGDTSLLAFSPRKAKISLYLEPEFPEREPLLKKFGKHTTGKSCVYVNKLDDIDREVLRELAQASLNYTQKKIKEKYQ